MQPLRKPAAKKKQSSASRESAKPPILPHTVAACGDGSSARRPKITFATTKVCAASATSHAHGDAGSQRVFDRGGQRESPGGCGDKGSESAPQPNRGTLQVRWKKLTLNYIPNTLYATTRSWLCGRFRRIEEEEQRSLQQTARLNELLQERDKLQSSEQSTKA